MWSIRRAAISDRPTVQSGRDLDRQKRSYWSRTIRSVWSCRPNSWDGQWRTWSEWVRNWMHRIHRENTQFLPEKHRLRQYAPIRRICLLIPVVKERCPVSCADIDHATIRKKWLHRLVMIRIWIMRQQRILCLQHMVPAISFLGMKWQIMYT